MAASKVISPLLLIYTTLIVSATAFPSPFCKIPRRYAPGPGRISSRDCQELWFEQTLDHYSWHNDTNFKQRYFLYDKFWTRPSNGRFGPIFFYAGNEADVELYVNATGLIWENAEDFGALVIFAEHRYYGQTQPFGPDSWRAEPRYLTTEQALADYATLLWALKAQLQAQDSPVVAFGGSYGGMLAAWLRRKYPHLVEGAVAASAPVAAFPGAPDFKPERFWEIVTMDATEAGGAPPECADNVRAAFTHLFSLAGSAEGLVQLRKAFRLCDELAGQEDATTLAYWVQGAFDAYAMGNYPYASTYISGDPDHPLPAWPMRAACGHMAGKARSQEQLLAGLADAAALLYNVSGDVTCFKLETTGPAAGNSGPWDYQFCTELMGQELPYYPATGQSDMFWDQGPWDLDGIRAHCAQAWGVAPRVHWSVVEWGGADWSSGTSNIVFSNGLLDPWSFAGVLRSSSPSVVVLLIPDGAHHVDLMYSHEGDTEAIRQARQVELEHMRAWVAGYWARREGRDPAGQEGAEGRAAGAASTS